MVRFFDGESASRMEELDLRKLSRPLVKTHLLEVLGGGNDLSTQTIGDVFTHRGVKTEQIDDSLYLAVDRNLGEIGFIEQLSPRLVALYSMEESKSLGPWVRNLVNRSPEIDHVWLSGTTFEVLWGQVVRLTRPERFSQLAFTHDSYFTIDKPYSRDEEDGAETGDEEDDEDEPEAPVEEEQQPIRDRRSTSFKLVDRVCEIDSRLERLQQTYAPFYAISQLRFPSPVGRGGHDFYDNGKVTNRSQNFRDHRLHVLYVVRVYQQLLVATEQKAWYSITESVVVPGTFQRIVGAPVVIRFQEDLPVDVFDHWVAMTFNRKINKFRLWGHPIRLGPSKVHVYGVDRHLWQPLFLELTRRGCTAIIPNGTCGNTVHRLVTNIQRFLDPAAKAFVGDMEYKALVVESVSGVPYGADAA